jgi:hypothetical protein
VLCIQTSGFLPSRAFRLLPALCVVLTAGLALPATRAWASEARRPTIDSMTSENQTEVSATVEAQINPQGLETAYEIHLICQEHYPGPSNCERLQVGAQPHTGHIAAGFGDQTITANFTGLHGSEIYTYAVTATNSIGTTEMHQIFQTSPVGASPNGTYIAPYESKMTPAGEEVSQAAAEEGMQRARERAKAQAEREATAKASQPSAPSPSNPPVTAPSSVSLASTGVTVQGGHVSLVQLECLGAASCNGKLTLSANIATKTKGAKKRWHTVTIGGADFSISSDEAKAVKLDISATGRALLSANHGRLRASLAILELPPSPESTLAQTVQLIQQPMHVRKSK